LICATIGRSLFTSRSFFEPMNFFTINPIMFVPCKPSNPTESPLKRQRHSNHTPTCWDLKSDGTIVSGCQPGLANTSSKGDGSGDVWLLGFEAHSRERRHPGGFGSWKELAGTDAGAPRCWSFSEALKLGSWSLCWGSKA
jgi:hypothetical protein